MKKIVLTLLLLLTVLTSNAGVKVMCDVIYKNNDGEWSDFLRTKVTFCLGYEIKEYGESREVFAIIMSQDNQPIVLKMKESHVQTQDLDMFNIFLLLCFNDMLNEGIDFVLYDTDIKQEWKIYAKNDIGLLIDYDLGHTESGYIYNQGTLQNRNNGFYLDRVKPKDDPKHEGESGKVVYKDHWSYYILKVNDKYFAMSRNDHTIMKSEIGEVFIGDFSSYDVQKSFYNETRDVDGYKFIVLKSFDNYEDCEKFIKSKWPY
jgi:hypothetical protein